MHEELQHPLRKENVSCHRRPFSTDHTHFRGRVVATKQREQTELDGGWEASMRATGNEQYFLPQAPPGGRGPPGKGEAPPPSPPPPPPLPPPEGRGPLGSGRGRAGF